MRTSRQSEVSGKWASCYHNSQPSCLLPLASSAAMTVMHNYTWWKVSSTVCTAGSHLSGNVPGCVPFLHHAQYYGSQCFTSRSQPAKNYKEKSFLFLISRDKKDLGCGMSQTGVSCGMKSLIFDICLWFLSLFLFSSALWISCSDASVDWCKGNHMHTHTHKEREIN